MPVHRVPGGWRWGNHGKVFRSKVEAERQAAAIYASGYREDARARADLHRALSASKRAESSYVLALQTIMRRTHASVLKHVGAPARADAAGDDSDARFLRRLFRFQEPEVQTAFDFMAGVVSKKSVEGARVVGIHAGDVPGLGAVIAEARARNVKLIQGATQDFLDQVRQTLEENEGKTSDEIAEALQERVGVSKSRGQLIARTETLRLNSNIAQHRQRAAGITQYKWSTSLDERVRPGHRELEGQVFSWDDPPDTGDGNRNHPGEDFQCRCAPIPVIASLEEPAEAEAAEEEPFAAAAEE